MTIVDIANLCIGFVLGGIVAFLVSWYWVRKYGAELEDKVREAADKAVDKVKDEIKQKLEEIKAK